VHLSITVRTIFAICVLRDVLEFREEVVIGAEAEPELSSSSSGLSEPSG
jgi:hypothetical protein